MAPEEQSAEFFGFFEVGGRTSSFIGPAIFGFLAAELAIYYGNQGLAPLAAEQTGIRVAVISIVFFLVVGLALFMFVRPRKHEAALEAN
ncbi:MAG: hypothetical protein HPY76_13850 [Anaerolineae bacterium]|nr:hypothetical protein [Anaerolineae bacterium]